MLTLKWYSGRHIGNRRRREGGSVGARAQMVFMLSLGSLVICYESSLSCYQRSTVSRPVEKKLDNVALAGKPPWRIGDNQIGIENACTVNATTWKSPLQACRICVVQIVQLSQLGGKHVMSRYIPFRAN